MSGMPVPAPMVAQIRDAFASIQLRVDGVFCMPLGLGASAAFIVRFTCPCCGPRQFSAVLKNVRAYIDYTDRKHWEPAALYLRDQAHTHTCGYLPNPPPTHPEHPTH